MLQHQRLAQKIFGPEVSFFQLGPLTALHHEGRIYGWDEDSASWHLLLPNPKGFSDHDDADFTFFMVMEPITCRCGIEDAVRAAEAVMRTNAFVLDEVAAVDPPPYDPWDYDYLTVGGMFQRPTRESLEPAWHWADPTP